MITADLRQRCETIARLEQQRKELAEQIKEHKAAAKDAGYDVPLITKTVSLMLKDTEKQKKALDQHSLFDSYLAAVGLLPEDETETQPSVASQAVERSAGDGPSQQTPPAAPIKVTMPDGWIGHAEHLPSAPASQTADQASGLAPRVNPDADPFKEDLFKPEHLDIPDFLRRKWPGVAA